MFTYVKSNHIHNDNNKRKNTKIWGKKKTLFFLCLPRIYCTHV